MTWRDVGKTYVSFEDLTERFSFKLHSMLRYTGRFHYTLWEREVIGPGFFERTGQFAPIYSMEMEVTDEPLDMRVPIAVETTIVLGRTAGPSGATTRIVAQAEQRLHGTSPEGKEVPIGRMLKHSIFTRPSGTAEERRVTTLHESLGLGPEPTRTFDLLTVLELSAPPVDFDPDPERRALTFEDSAPHVWGYEQTDPNRHVHAMDYVKVMEPFGWNHLAAGGISAADHFYDACRIVFRAPCFRGGRYLRAGRFEPRDARRGGGGVLLGKILKADSEAAPPDPARPAVALQLGVRPNAHPDSGGHDLE
jgi:hypothetical protein